MRRPALLSFAFFLAISGCAGTTATKQPAYSASQLRNMGENYLSGSDTAGALECLTQAEQKSPNDPVIQYDLGLAYDQRELPDKALSHFQKALTIKPDYSEALNAIGSVYAKRGQVELARQAFQKAMDNPFYKTPEIAAYNIGRLYEKKDDLEMALTDYQQAVKFNPQFGTAWLRIGRVLEKLNRADEARHAYGNAVKASPDLAEAQLRYGIMSFQVGDMDVAASSLSRVRRIVPNTDMADEARRYLEKLTEATRAKTRSRGSSYTPPGEIEVIPNGNIQREQANETLPPSHPPQLPPPSIQEDVSSPPAPAQREIPEETQASPAKKAPVSAVGGAPAQGRVAEDSGSQSYKYIVQVGSFVDREKAEEFKKNLDGKGYKAIVKPLNHKVLGKVFVIQLQPVASVAKATTLMTQLSNEVQGEPVIIKVPAQ